MDKLPKEILTHFLKGEHVMSHMPGIWNAIWSDMYIESTFMRYGHGPNDIVGIRSADTQGGEAIMHSP